MCVCVCGAHQMRMSVPWSSSSVSPDCMARSMGGTSWKVSAAALCTYSAGASMRAVSAGAARRKREATARRSSGWPRMSLTIGPRTSCDAHAQYARVREEGEGIGWGTESSGAA